MERTRKAVEMSETLNLRQLKIPVTNLMKKVFSREKISAHLDVGVGERGLDQRGDWGDLELELWLESSPDGIRAKGDIKGTVAMECTRCLEGYRQEIRIEVDEFYRRPGLQVEAGDGRRLAQWVEVPEEDDYVIEQGMIDLNVLLNDAILLNIPIKHLCREDCNGLCPICGTNLNRASCGCVQEDVHPGLEVLRTLLDREDT